ncbi:palmitoyltransferase ZDHHC12-B-like isoform X2 [Watersipora subatra]|uniref:palmitoyltransferase ZDHHC12-B-like isoform X2 n=1 Tax=Watersipora subatra TaxID=2589382 RepID=UPI00355BA5C9
MAKSKGCCSIVNVICSCLTCGGGLYVVRFIHTLLSVAIPANLMYNRHTVLNQWLVRREGNYIYGILYIAILLASLIFYFCACLKNPGYVDQAVLSHLAEDEEEEELFTQRKSHKYSPVHTSDPLLADCIDDEHNRLDRQADQGSMENLNSSNSAAILPADNITQIEESIISHQTEVSAANLVPDRTCKICKIPQPIRSRHCEDCNRCVLKYDHHCPWLSTCVGEKNHKFFWLFLLFINIVIIFSAIIAVKGFPSHKQNDPDFDGREIASILFTILDCIIFLVGGLSTISLFGFHSYLMCTNQTTWESVSRTRISYLKKLKDDYNPFDMGLCYNTYTFCCRRKPKHWRSVYKKSTSSVHLFEEV